MGVPADRLQRALAARFINRGDAWVVQAHDGRYRALRGRLGRRQLTDHLAGRASLCAYALSPAGDAGPPGAALCRWGALDLDAHRSELAGDGRVAPAARRALLELARTLEAGLSAIVGRGPVVLEASGGLGLHVWVLFAGAAPAPLCCALLDAALRRAGVEPGARVEIPGRLGLAVERYPKRARLAPGEVGSALRLPLGRHPRTGRRSVLVDPAGGAVRDPLLSLLSPASRRLDRQELARRLERAGIDPAPRAAVVAGPRTSASWVAASAQSAPPVRVTGPVAPDAWLSYRWAVARLGLSDRTSAPPPASSDGRGYPVRCLFPAAHAHGDRGAGSAYLIRRGDTQLYGCAVCEGGRAMSTISLLRLLAPELDFGGVLDLCHAIDPARCPSRVERARGRRPTNSPHRARRREARALGRPGASSAGRHEPV